jgi:hypothetical protein
MSADLHIHVFEGITRKDLAAFFSHTLGSKYFNISAPRPDGISAKIEKTPNVWIGEVSWLGASFSDDPDAFVPQTVGLIYGAIGENLPVLDKRLRKKILGAFDAENPTSYRLTTPETVQVFLNEHMGKRVFMVSW